MTTQSQAKEAIYGAFKSGWSNPYYFDNEVVETEDGNWARLTVRHSTSNQETLGPVGNRKFQRNGNVIVQLFTKLGEATDDVDSLSATIRAIFEGKTISGVNFSSVNVREIGPSGAWYQTNIEAPFNYTETL